MEVVAFIAFWFGATWDFFTEIKVPGFDFSFAALFVGLFLASLGIRFVSAMLGMSLGLHDVVKSGDAYERKSLSVWKRRRGIID